jgi:hypothetical protein
MDKIFKSEFYGDQLRWFVGTVEDVSDPARLGRVRVRVRGLHTDTTADIQTSDLPWAQVIIPSTEGGVSGIGQSTGLLPGAEVFGIFADGQNSQLPIVFGSYAQFETSSSVQVAGSSADDNIVNSGITSSTGRGTGTTGYRNSANAENLSAYGIDGDSNPEKAFNFFLNYGFTAEQSAGIVGNLMQESGPSLNTSVKAAGTEQSFGIAQWNAASGRYQELQEFAKDLGQPWTDLDVQLRFITFELEKYPYLGLSKLRAARTIEEATIAFEEKYERPSVPHRNSRLAYAKDIYKRMI